MPFQLWNVAFNALIMLFWFRLWTRNDRNLFFNPHLSALDRLSDSIITFARPLFVGIPEHGIPAVLIGFLLVLRALFIALGAPLVLNLGFLAAGPQAGIISCLAFSFLSFAIFLFMLWTLSLLYTTTRFSAQSDRTVNAVDRLARPFSYFRPEIRPLVLLLAGIILSAALMSTHGARPGPATSSAHSILMLGIRLVLSALAGSVNILKIIHSTVILLIIGSWVSMFTSSQSMMTFCNEWLNFLMGPLRRYPIVIGMFNITPLVFMFAIGLLHQALLVSLYRAYLATL